MTKSAIINMEQPVRRYVPRKPNYYPAPPPEPNFFDDEPLDGHVIAIIRSLTFFIFAASFLYGTFAWYFEKYSMPYSPRVKVEVINTTYFNFNLPTTSLTVNWHVEIITNNTNKDWNIFYHPTIANLIWPRANITLGVRSRRVTQDPNGAFLMGFRLNSVGRNLSNGWKVSPNVPWSLLVYDQSEGLLPLDLIVGFTVVFKKTKWPHYQTREYLLEYKCGDLKVAFSRDGVGRLHKKRNCDLMLNEPLQDVNKRVQEERGRAAS